MIKKFISIKNIGKFKDYSAYGDVELRKLNIVYGGNASGKTTLSAILWSLKTGNKDYIVGRRTLGIQDPPVVTIRTDSQNLIFSEEGWNETLQDLEIFDSIFVADNICAGYCVDHQHKKNLHLFAIGEEAVQLSREIVKSDKDIRNINEKIQTQELKIKKIIIGDFPFEEFIKLSQENRIKEKMEDIKGIIVTLNKSKELLNKPLLDTLDIASFEFNEIIAILKQSLDSIAKDVEEKVQLHIKECLGKEGEQWIEFGLQHVENNRCPFCGLDLTASGLFSFYKQYFDDRYQQLKNNIRNHVEKMPSMFDNNFLLNLQKIIANNNSTLQYYFQFKFCDINEMSFDFDKCKDEWTHLQKILNVHLRHKLANPLDIVEPSDELQNAITKFNLFINEMRDYNNKISEINADLKAKKKDIDVTKLPEIEQKLVRLQDQLKRYSAEVIKLIEEYDSLKNTKKELENNKSNKKENLNNLTKNTIEKYQNSINAYLEKFGADLRIVNQKVQYLGGSPSVDYNIEICGEPVELGDRETPLDQPSFKNTVSEGDKSTLAFAFFLARLDQDETLSDKIVIFDDPINSLDIHRRNSSVYHILGICANAKQVIVFTHEPSFAKCLWREMDRSLVKCLCAIDDTAGVSIKEWDIERETAGEDYHDREILKDFMVRGNGNLLGVVRCIRPLLEACLRRKYPGIFSLDDCFGNMIDKIRSCTNEDPLAIIKSNLPELEEINSYSRTYHHGSESGAEIVYSMPDRGELKTYVTRALSLVDSW